MFTETLFDSIKLMPLSQATANPVSVKELSDIGKMLKPQTKLSVFYD